MEIFYHCNDNICHYEQLAVNVTIIPKQFIRERYISTTDEVQQNLEKQYFYFDFLNLKSHKGKILTL